MPFYFAALLKQSHYGNTLPYAPSHHQSIKFSLSLSLLCFEITLLSFSQLLPYLPPRRSSRSFSQTLLSTFDSASSCVPISSRISWIYRNRVKPPPSLDPRDEKKINVCEAFEEVMVVKLLIQDDKLRFDSLNNRGRGGSVVLECGTLRCICCCYFSFFILPYALLGSFPFHLADQNRIKCVFFILISIHLLLLHLHQLWPPNQTSFPHQDTTVTTTTIVL